jgi:succinoglycan biosynthesis transport protein ExoP
MNANLMHRLTPAGPVAPEPPAMVDPRRLLSIIRRRWRVIALAVTLSVAATALWLLWVTPIYTATATVLIDPRKTTPVKDEAIVSNLALDVNTIATEVSLIKSFAVSRRVVERLHLQDDPQFGGEAAPSPGLIKRLTGWLSVLLGNGGDGEDGETGDDPAARAQGPVSPELLGLINSFRSAIDVRRVSTTYFIEVSYAHASAELSARLANAVVESYLDEQLETRYQAAKRAANWLTDRVQALRGQLEASERQLAEHRAKFNLAKTQDGTLAEQQAVEINTQLIAARAQTVEKKAKYEEARRILETGKAIEGTAAVMDSPTIAALRVQESSITRQEAELLSRYGPEHPAIRKIRAERADVNRQIKLEVGRVVQTLRSDYEFARKKEESLDGSLRELTGRRNPDDEAIVRMRELQRDVDSNRVLYDAMLARSKEVEQQTNLPAGESRMVAPAFTPKTASFPKRGFSLLIAIVGGLALGAGLIVLLEYQENGFTSATQLEQTLDLPVLAVIPTLSAAERHIDGRVTPIPRYAVLRPQSRFGESIRSMRMLTQMAHAGPPPQVVLITSSVPAEGKTTLATSLAASAAAGSRQRVLLIDCDLRAQSVTRQFNLGKRPGLVDFVSDQRHRNASVFHQITPNLAVLPAGAPTSDPPDILGSETMRAMLRQLREEYDVIYLDAPPILPVVDSVVLAKLADKVVLVVRWQTTPRNIALRAMQLIEDPLQKLSGVVLNNAALDQLMSYDPYNTHHHKTYGTYYAQ